MKRQTSIEITVHAGTSINIAYRRPVFTGSSAWPIARRTWNGRSDISYLGTNSTSEAESQHFGSGIEASHGKKRDRNKRRVKHSQNIDRDLPKVVPISDLGKEKLSKLLNVIGVTNSNHQNIIGDILIEEHRLGIIPHNHMKPKELKKYVQGLVDSRKINFNPWTR
jgi:hypothetical protein